MTGQHVVTAIGAAAVLVTLATCAYLFAWAEWVAIGAWPRYWWMTVITSLLCAGVIAGAVAAVTIALRGSSDVGLEDNVRRIALYLVAPSVIGLVFSAIVLVVVLVTIPSFY
jgi:hypothetical protein